MKNTIYHWKEVLLTFKIIHRKCGVMHYARKNSLCEDGDRPFYHNPARLKMGFHILYFHFHTRSTYLKWSNQTVPVHPLHIYKEFTPIVTYPMQSGPDVQPFLGKQSFVYALLHCRSKGPADVFSVIWPIRQNFGLQGGVSCHYFQSVIYIESKKAKVRTVRQLFSKKFQFSYTGRNLNFAAWVWPDLGYRASYRS